MAMRRAARMTPALAALVAAGALGAMRTRGRWAGDPARAADRRGLAARCDPGAAALGQLLFYDPILSGGREVACATCHHPRFGTSDGVSLGHRRRRRWASGPTRVPTPTNMPEERVPRNAQALFNLGAREYARCSTTAGSRSDDSRPSGLRTPLEEEMVAGFDSLLSAQTMFPVSRPDEMAGHYSENEVSQAVRLGLITGPGGAWDLIARRVAAIPDYARAFRAGLSRTAGRTRSPSPTSPTPSPPSSTFEWRSDASPFDA